MAGGQPMVDWAYTGTDGKTASGLLRVKAQ
jgi:hypothetical protein